MKRKNFLIVFSAAFFIALLAIATAPTNASPTNNWGVSEGTTLNYKGEFIAGDHSTEWEYEIMVVTIKDTSTPSDDLDDLFYTEKVKLEGSEFFVSDGRLSGADAYNYWDIVFPFISADTIPDLYPILPIDDEGPGSQGLNWDDAKSDIKALAPAMYDSVDVTEDGDMFKVEIEDHGSGTWGDWDKTITVEWDKSKGTLESYSYETVYEDVGLTEKAAVSKGGISEGVLEGNAPIIAAAALGLAFLAFLMVLVKK